MSQKSWSARNPVLFGLFGLFGLLGGFTVWATQTQISGAIIASGRIEVDQNRQIVQHPTGGVVAAIEVEEGDLVAAGDLLIQLDTTQMESALAIIEAQLFELMARRGRLTAERDGRDEIIYDPELLAAEKDRPEVRELVEGQTNLFHARRETVARQTDQLEKRADQIRNQIVGIQAQEDSLGRQLALIREELEAQQSLFDRGLSPAARVLALERENASLDGRIGELAASRAQSEERITENELEVLRINTQRREDAITQLRDIRSRETELTEQRLALLAEIEQMEIRSPVSGIIYGMRVQTIRSVIRAAEPILFVIPQDRPLVIAAQVSPINIDEIFVGQSVNLRFSSLDQRKTPELVGEVVLVSADAFENENLGTSFYRAEIVLNPGEMNRLPEGQILIPGMPVEAFIKTDERSPMAYLIKPMADFFNRAFRET